MGFVFGPSWFYGLDSTFEFVALFVTLFIAFYTFRVFLLTKLRKYLYFTLAFLFISISYFIRATLDYLVYTSLLGRVPNLTAAVSTVAKIPTLYSLGSLAYIFFIFAGFMILVAIFLRIKSFITVSLLFILVLILAFLSQNRYFAFHITMFVLLFYVVVHLLKNHARTRTINSFLVLYSMAAIMVAQVFFFLLTLGPFYYVVGHGLQLFGFVLLLVNMILVFRK